MRENLEELAEPLLRQLEKTGETYSINFLKKSTQTMGEWYTKIGMSNVASYLEGITYGIELQLDLERGILDKTHTFEIEGLKERLDRIKEHKLEYLAGISSSVKVLERINISYAKPLNKPGKSKEEYSPIIQEETIENIQVPITQEKNTDEIKTPEETPIIEQEIPELEVLEVHTPKKELQTHSPKILGIRHEIRRRTPILVDYSGQELFDRYRVSGKPVSPIEPKITQTKKPRPSKIKTPKTTEKPEDKKILTKEDILSIFGLNK